MPIVSNATIKTPPANANGVFLYIILFRFDKLCAALIADASPHALFLPANGADADAVFDFRSHCFVCALEFRATIFTPMHAFWLLCFAERANAEGIAVILR